MDGVMGGVMVSWVVSWCHGCRNCNKLNFISELILYKVTMIQGDHDTR